MLSRLAIRRMASPSSPATETTSTLVRERDGLRLDAVGHEQALESGLASSRSTADSVSRP